MKEIKAIIQPFRLQAVIDALHQIKDLPAVTISTAQGLSVERGTHDQVVKTKLEIMVQDQQVEQLVQVIQKAAHTGNPGDGCIFVLPIEMAAKIRTGGKAV